MQVYCLINCKFGQEESVYNFLKSLNSLGSISRLQNSAYDIIAKFLTNNDEEMSNLITWTIRKNEGIQSMQQLICINSKEEILI